MIILKYFKHLTCFFVLIIIVLGCNIFPDKKHKFEEYQNLLKLAKNKNYKVISVIDWFENYEQLKNERVIIMRHDVDHDPETAKMMGLVEVSFGFHSTYYFRWKTVDKKIIEYLKNLRHETGLHYETIATYCKQNNITDKNDVTPDVIETCRKILIKEILKFEYRYGDIQSICSHGDERNRLLGIPNIVLMKGENPVDYHIKTWANSKELRDIPEIFVADSGNKWEPFSFEEAMEKDYKTIYVLIHPIWWSRD